jgi:DNA-binding transcriptional MerR regulator
METSTLRFPLSHGTAAMQLGVLAPTLDSWERRGLLGEVQRDSTGRRLYSQENIDAARAHMTTRRRNAA